jgi:hypothetical protein
MATAGNSLTAPVTVAVTALNYEKGTGKFHLDYGCTGLAKRSSILLTVELGRATSKGVLPCNYCATGKSGHWTGYKAPHGALPSDCYNFTGGGVTSGGTAAAGTGTPTSSATASTPTPAPGNWSPFRGPPPTSGTSAASSPEATLAPEVGTWPASTLPGLETLLTYPATKLQKDFVAGLTTTQEHYKELLSTSDRGLLQELYWVACSQKDFDNFAETGASSTCTSAASSGRTSHWATLPGLPWFTTCANLT